MTMERDAKRTGGEMNALKRVLAVAGDFYHDDAVIRRALEKALAPFAEAGRLELAFAEREQLIGLLDGRPDLVVLFAENRTDPQGDESRVWMTEDMADKIVRYVRGGGAWLAWHSGLASYPENGAYVGMLKGRFLYHPPEHAAVTYTPEAGTDLGELGGPFRLKDEHYFVDCREPDTTVFLRSRSAAGESAAGWFHPFGEGRVACLAPAHLEEGLLDPDFMAVMRRVVAWCLQI